MKLLTREAAKILNATAQEIAAMLKDGRLTGITKEIDLVPVLIELGKRSRVPGPVDPSR